MFILILGKNQRRLAKKKNGPLWCYYLESSILVIIRFPWEDMDLYRHEFVLLSVLSQGQEIVCSIFWMVRPKYGRWSKTKHAGPAMAVFHPGLGLPENSKTLTCCYCRMERMMCSMISNIITFFMAMFITTGIKAQTQVVIYKALWT